MIENEMLNGEVIRLDGAMCLAAKYKIAKPARVYYWGKGYDYRARIVPDNPFAFPPLHKDVLVPQSPGRGERVHPWRPNQVEGAIYDKH